MVAERRLFRLQGGKKQRQKPDEKRNSNWIGKMVRFRRM